MGILEVVRPIVLWDNGAEIRERYCNVRFSLYIGDSQGTSACKKQFINAVCNDKYSVFFRHQNIYDFLDGTFR